MKIFGAEDVAEKKVWEDVKKYFEIHLPEYKPKMIFKYSDHPDDGYLYMVEAKKHCPDKFGRGDWACWTCWNEQTESLGYGHYDLESEGDALEILSNAYRSFPKGTVFAH